MMKKNKVLKHFREITQVNISELSLITGISENHIRDIEKGYKTIPTKLIAYYSSCLKVDPLVMNALLGSSIKSHYLIASLQDAVVSVLLKYLELSKWMYDYNKKIEG
jgi:hypothetical protein